MFTLQISFKPLLLGGGGGGGGYFFVEGGGEIENNVEKEWEIFAKLL